MIIGAAKSGTSSLYYYLKQHPQIFMCTPKEPTFFGHEGTEGLYCGPHDEDRAYHSRIITNIDDYADLFKAATDDKSAIGEASVYYLYLPSAPAQIKDYLPKVTMVAILRNPVERAYSAYLHVVRQAREPYSFTRALQEEAKRIRRKWNPLWYFKSLGYYHEQVKRYYDTFGRGQVHVFLYDDFRKNQLLFIRNICDLLGVDTSFAPDMSRRYKVAFVPKSASLEKLLYRARNSVRGVQGILPRRIAWRLGPVVKRIDRSLEHNHAAPPSMPANVRKMLQADYREDILRLQDLLGRDLSCWLTEFSETQREAASQVANAHL